jgi:hypothetical protein
MIQGLSRIVRPLEFLFSNQPDNEQEQNPAEDGADDRAQKPARDCDARSRKQPAGEKRADDSTANFPIRPRP